MLASFLAWMGSALDRRFGWQRLPKPLGILTLVGLRVVLRRKNLYDASSPGSLAEPGIGGAPADTSVRTLDGTYNDLSQPRMGSIGSRFGRNVPLTNPRTVSRELLTRDEFIPATTLNLLAAAWIQFEVHDWFSHGKNEPTNPWVIALAADDPWPHRPMEIPRTRRDPSYDPASGAPPTFITDDTHWWDGSQIYGTDPAFAQAIRTGEGGKLRIDSAGLVPKEIEAQVDLTGVAGNFWLGLAILHALFMLEHNAICDRLHEQHPELGDDELYDKARLANAALMAKIHTVDWTPAIIAHPTTVKALRTNWWGLEGERLDKLVGRLTSNEVIRGIPGSPTNLHGVPYSLTEEFVSVYRMHPLIPDDYTFWSAQDGHELGRRKFGELGALHVRERMQEIPLVDSMYSFGLLNPGAIVLHNYPRGLQQLERPDGELLDLAAIDILRSRERGVPRYNEFRRLFHLKAPASFEELTGGDAKAAEELRRVYGDVERVDLSVGLFAEPLPPGFAFSDTAFRVFILMASRRVKSDRFFTRDHRPDVYTRAGLDWVNENTMRSVLLRHLPQLAPALDGIENAFVPWKEVTAPGPDMASAAQAAQAPTEELPTRS